MTEKKKEKNKSKQASKQERKREQKSERGREEAKDKTQITQITKIDLIGIMQHCSQHRKNALFLSAHIIFTKTDIWQAIQ